MASSSSAPCLTWKYDVFPSFRGEDVRETFLSHLLKELSRKAINTFSDNGIKRTTPIAPELLSAIRESRISVVIFSENYASSTWCLNELLEIHKFSEELKIHKLSEEFNQMVFPIFYKVDPSDVRKQTGEFGKIFEKTCEGETDEDLKKQWRKALADVAGRAGEHSKNWKSDEKMIEEISEDVSNKLFTTLDDFRDFVGIDAHIEAMNPILSLESEESRMVGIVGISGIGKSTIGRALFSRRKSQFDYHAFVCYKRSIKDKKNADFEVKLSWVNQFLSDILGVKDIKNDSLGAVKERLKHKKVFVVLDDVDERALLKTLVGEPGWFGAGSRIIVITQDRELLQSHKINLIHEVEFPSEDMALKMFCQSAFGRNSPPDGFMELAVEVAKLAGNLPLGLNVLGSSLSEKTKDEWVETMPMLRDDLEGEITKTLQVGYDRLDNKSDQELFLYIACLFNGESFSYINDLLEGVYTSVHTRIKRLADKSLIRITTPDETVQMHTLLQKLGIEIVREESYNDPGRRRFLVDVEDIREVLTYKTGTENVLGICLNKSDIYINEPFFLDENSFEGMRRLQFLKFYGGLCLRDVNEVKFNSPRGIVYLPRKLRLLHWDMYPAKYIPSNFSAECLVELKMEDSKLEKLWEGTQPLRCLKKMNLNGSIYLQEIPDLSNATNLEELLINYCQNLATLPSSIRNLKKLKVLKMAYCTMLEDIPTNVNLESLEHLDLRGCFPLKVFPWISEDISILYLNGKEMDEDICKSFISHLLKELDHKSIKTFRDHGIERSHPTEPGLLSAIRESRISFVMFSKKYGSSTWCLNELVEIHKCYEDLGQMVVPIFYKVDPSNVRKQTGKFGEAFQRTCIDSEKKETCKDKTEDQKQSWIRALVNNDYGDFVGIEAHIERLNSMLCLETKEVKMVGILGPSGIGKTTIARALFSQLYSQLEHQAFVSYKRTIDDDNEMKLAWEEQFLSEILCQKDLKLEGIGAVEQRLKHKKVLAVLDDVDDLELLKTLVGVPGWFGPGSRIIVITQDRELLKSHKIKLIHEVEFPSEDIALKMFCVSAFGRNSPPVSFKKLAVEFAKLAGNLPLGLNILGSFLRGRGKQEWAKMMPRIQGALDDKIGDVLKVIYDRLDNKSDQELFLYIACLLNGESVSYINDLLEGVYTSVNLRLKMLACKSLLRITTPEETVQIHVLLQKFGRQIVREESKNDPGKRRFLVDLKDIREVFTFKNGTGNVLGICLNQSDIDELLLVDENSFEGMCNLHYIKFYGGSKWAWLDCDKVKLKSHPGLSYLPPKLQLLHWDRYPWKYIPSNFKAEYLVELIMEKSKLQRLWEGTLPLQCLKKMDLHGSRYLKKIPNLSKAKNLKVLNLLDCSELMVLPKEVNFKSLEHLGLTQCLRLKFFPRISTSIASRWIENILQVTHLRWSKCPLRCMPSNFRTEHLVELEMSDSRLEKLWEGVQPLENLENMDMRFCENLKKIPDLSKATKLKKLDMFNCKSLEDLQTDVNLKSLEELILFGCLRLRSFPQISTSIKRLNLEGTAIEEVPSWIENISNLEKLDMRNCYRLKDLTTDVNLESLEELDFHGCSRLRTFPQISTSIKELNLYGSVIEEVPSWIENMSELQELDMRFCQSLKNISASIFKLRHLKKADFSDCYELTSFSDASVVAKVACITDVRHFHSDDLKYFNFSNCSNLDRNAHEFILGLSLPMMTVLPGGEVPTYFTHRSCGNSLIITLPQSSHDMKACIVAGSADLSKPKLEVHWRFRGLNGVKLFDLKALVFRDQVVVFNFELNSHLSAFRSAAMEHKCRQCELDFNYMEFEFLLIDEKGKIEIKGCGIRVLDAESGRSKKKMQMTETTSEEPSKDQLIAEWMARDLGLSLGHDEEDWRRVLYKILGCREWEKQVADDAETTSEEPSNSLYDEAFAQVSSTSKITSSSVSITNNFHGDDGASSST